MSIVYTGARPGRSALVAFQNTGNLLAERGTAARHETRQPVAPIHHRKWARAVQITVPITAGSRCASRTLSWWHRTSSAISCRGTCDTTCGIVDVRVFVHRAFGEALG